MIGLALGAATSSSCSFSVQGGLFNYIVENLIFAQGAGEHRLDIYYYGTLEVLRHPWFGVGLNDWARPFWRPHPTIDSFWLMTAMRTRHPEHPHADDSPSCSDGLRISRARGLDEDGATTASGYLIALCGLILIPQHRAHLGADHRVRDGLSSAPGPGSTPASTGGRGPRSPCGAGAARDAGAGRRGGGAGRVAGARPRAGSDCAPAPVGYDRTSAASQAVGSEDGVRSGQAGRTGSAAVRGGRRPGRPPGKRV